MLQTKTLLLTLLAASLYLTGIAATRADTGTTTDVAGQTASTQTDGKKPDHDHKHPLPSEQAIPYRLPVMASQPHPQAQSLQQNRTLPQK